MNLFKRMTALVLAGVLTIGLLSACGSGDGESSSQSAAQSSSSSAEANALTAVDLTTITDISTYLCGLPSGEVVASVNGTPITAGELMYCLVTGCDNMVEYYYYYQGTQELPWNTVLAAEDGEIEDGAVAEEKTFAEYMLNDAVKTAAMQIIVETKAKEAGITVTKENAEASQASLDMVTQQLAADTDKITVEQALWTQALTKDDFIRLYNMEYLYQGLTDHYYGEGGENEPAEEILLSYADAAGYYAVKHILLETKESTDEEKAEKKAKAEELLAQLKASGNDEALFDKLMKEHTEDPGIATNPEGYTFQANTNIDPAFEEAALALEPGQLSEIVEGQHGYHIMRRMPMKVTDDLKTDFINEQMSLMGTMWVESAEIEMTEAGKTLDAKAVYDAMQNYRYTVAKVKGEAE